MVALLSSLQLWSRVEPFFGMGKLELVTFLVDKVDGSIWGSLWKMNHFSQLIWFIYLSLDKDLLDRNDKDLLDCNGSEYANAELV